MEERRTDPEKLAQKQALIAQITFGAYTAAMVNLGLRLGLYEALAAGAATAARLAERTGLHERWLREWLQAQAAAGVIEYEGEGSFRLSAEMAELLTHAASPSFAGGRLLSLPAHLASLDRLPQAFRSGLGFTWDDRGPGAIDATERARRAWYERDFVSRVIPAVEGLQDKLMRGARAADVGCGTGLALVQLGRAFPRSRFQGFEVSAAALARAEANRAAAELTNVTFHDARQEPLPQEPTFDLVLTFDCLHDMTDPARAAREIRRALRPDGVWLIMEIDAAPTFEENLARDPARAAVSYAISVLSCLPSSMAEAGAVGYGTLGLPEPALRELAAGAGFRQLRRLNLPTPLFNALYEARL